MSLKFTFLRKMFLSATIFFGLIVVGVFYIVKQIKIVIRNYAEVSKMPGPPGKGFLIGNMTYLHTTPDQILKRLREAAKKYYPIYKMYALHKVQANILSPDDAELILSNPMHNRKADIYRLLHNWLNDGLLVSYGSKWRTRRKILTPAFHFNILQEFIQIFNEEGDKLVESFRKECSRPYVNVTSHITQYTLKTIAETAMGTKLNFHTKKEIDYKEAVYKIGKLLLYRLLRPWLISNFIFKFSPRYPEELKVTNTLHDFTRGVIKHREENFKDIELPKEEYDVYRGKKRLAMLDLLLSAKRNEKIIDDEGIQEEVDTFMFEGHDTTAAALSFALMLIACHKDIQDLIVEELGEVLGDMSKKPTYNDLQGMNYLERCIKETLRLYPSVYFIARTLGANVKTISGYLLPKNTPITIHIYDIHHNADIYPDPEKFDPDRFLPEKNQDRHPYAYLPFSAGSRNCIGQKFALLQLKAALCAILSNFIVKPLDTPETITLVADIILRTKEGIKVKFVERIQNQKCELN